MLAVDSNTLWIDNHTHKLVDFLLRYTHGQEYSENELQAFLTSPQLEAFPSTSVEQAFLMNHIENVRIKCVEIYLKAKNASMGQQLDHTFNLWSEHVYPKHLMELDILSSDGLNTLRVAFATITRSFINISKLVSWLSLTENFHYTQDILRIGLDEEVNAVLAKIIPNKIENYIQTNWSNRYESDVPKKITQWVSTGLIPDVKHLMSLHNDNTVAVPIQQINEIATASLARLRISELYNIVKTNQDLGLEDLAQALTERPDLRDETVHSFIQQCEQRLLNGASDTVEIIQMFLQTVHAFSILDPQGVLLEKVSKPIRSMLKERSDTSIKLAEGIFGDTNSPLSFLFHELQKQTKPLDNIGILQAFDDWVPDPVDTPVDFVRKQTQDSVTTLIDLYDNKEVFIKQFVNLFGAELLNKPFQREENTDRLNNLFHLLSSRFGVLNMQKIEVMLKDVLRSENINRQIQQQCANSNIDLSSISPLVLSRLYWPYMISKASNKHTSSQILPTRFQKLLKDYEEQFAKQDDFDTLELQWLPDQGRIRIELILADRVLEMAVQLHEAVLLSAFSDENAESSMTESTALTLSELEKITNLDERQLLAAIQFWVEKGVLGTDGEKYKVLETSAEAEEQRKAPNQVVSSIDMVTSSSTGSSKHTKESLDEMHVYWSYIVGMLTNLGSLPLDKIHSFLVMFVPNEDPYVKTKQELESYLLAMVDDDKLKLEDGKYSLLKK